MAVWSIVDYREMEKAERFDPEYFQPAYKTLYSQMKDGLPLSEFIFSAQRGQAPEYDEGGDIPVIRTVNVRDLMFSDTRAAFVQASFLESSRKGRVEQRDIVVTSTGLGTLGRTFCNMSPTSYFADGHITVLTPRAEADECFLTAVLQSRVGCMQFEQKQRGSSGQIEIYPDDILSVIIPKVSDTLQKQISSTWRAAIQLVQDAENAYPQAEAELLERLGWEEIENAPRELFYEANWDEMRANERADPEFFQPHYARLRKRIADKGTLTLGSALEFLDKGAQPDGYDSSGEIRVVKSKNVSGRGINWEGCERTTRGIWNKAFTARLRNDDVVFNATGLGTLGRADVIRDLSDDALAAVDLLICRTNPKKILPIYLSLFLNSPAGLAQSDQAQTGSSGQLHLYPSHLWQYQIFVPRNADGSIDLVWQKHLADKVLEASSAKARAREKLDEAKALVEKAIGL